MVKKIMIVVAVGALFLTSEVKGMNTSETVAKQTQTTYEQYDKIKSFVDLGYFLEDYIVDGGIATKDVTVNNVLQVSDVIASLKGDVVRRQATSFTTSTPSTNYYLDFGDNGDFHFGTSHYNGNYLPLAAVQTDMNGNIQWIVDKRGSLNGFRSRQSANFTNMPSIVGFDMVKKYRAWQGVTTDGTYIYVVTGDPDDLSRRNNIISVYDMDGNFVYELLDAYTGTDSAGRKLCFGNISYINGLLYVPSYNFNDGGPPPYESKVAVFTPYNGTISNSSLQFVKEINIGTGVAEGVAYYIGDYWVCYHDMMKIRRFDSDWNVVATYDLPQTMGADGAYQGAVWYKGDLYLNMHGPNGYGHPQTGRIDRYSFNGSAFSFVESYDPPTYGSTQGIAEYNGLFFFNDRVENRVIITQGFKHGRIKGIVEQSDVLNDATLKQRSAFRAYQSTTTPIPVNTWTKVSYQTEVYDHKGEYDPVSSKFTAKEAGIYMISAYARVNTTADGTPVGMMLYKNGVQESRLFFFPTGAALNIAPGGTAAVKLNAGDTIEAYIYIGNATETVPSDNATYFEAVRIA